MRPQLIATSANGKTVSFYGDSYAAMHFKEDSTLQSLSGRAIRASNLDANKPLVEFDFGVVIGKSNLVQTGPRDKIVYAQRVGRRGYTRFALDREKTDCTKLTLVMKASEYHSYSFVLISAWIGPLMPTYPGRTAAAKQKAEDFWSKHALVWGSQEVVPETVTNYCPW